LPNETNVQKCTKWKKKLADKPGSVLTLRQATVIHLGASLLIRSSNLPADGASHAIVSLFGLAADGGCRVSPVSTQVRNFRCSQVEPTRLCGPIPRLIPCGLRLKDFSGRLLAVIPLYAARTFLPRLRRRRLSSQLQRHSNTLALSALFD